MEISSLNNLFPFSFNINGNESNGAAPVAVQDKIDISSAHILEDDEVDSVFDETLHMIAEDNLAALSVHEGLNESRVFTLLGM